MNNFGIVNFAENEDRIEKFDGTRCKFHWTDGLEIVLMGIALLLVIRVVYSKYREHQMRKQTAKMEGLRLMYRQALNGEPSAPATVTVQPASNCVTPYEGVRREMDGVKMN